MLNVTLTPPLPWKYHSRRAADEARNDLSRGTQMTRHFLQVSDHIGGALGRARAAVQGTEFEVSSALTEAEV